MTKEQQRKMIELAEFLYFKVPDEEFHIGSWASFRGIPREHKVLPGCGTVACAVGWATYLWPEAERADFIGMRDVTFSGYDFAAKLFGISEPESYELFNWHQPNDRKLIASKLVDFANNYQLEDE